MPSRRVLCRRAIKAGTVKAVRVPLAVGEVVAGAHGAGLSARRWQVGSVCSRSGFALCSAGRSNLGSLVPSRQVSSGVALRQAGLVGRSIGWAVAQCWHRVELAVGGGAAISRS